MSIHEAVEQDVWAWIREFVTVQNEFYGFKFAPCPYARAAVLAETVDVVAFRSGDFRPFIHANALGVRDSPKLTTRVMAFPPRMQSAWGLSEYVEDLNRQLIPDEIFLNTGVAKTSRSRYPGSGENPYFIVVANSLGPVLKGAEALRRTDYYKDWPQSHYAIVVERRSRMAERYGRARADEEE